MLKLTSIVISQKDCSVCNKRNCRIDKSVICNNCYSSVHRKCSKLKPTEISDLKNGRNLKWECTTCGNNKFLFTFSDDKYIMSNIFNSNFDCRGNISSNFQLCSSKYIFQNNLDNFKKDNKFNIIDENDTIMDDFLIQPHFKYYQNHELYKHIKKNQKIYLEFSILTFALHKLILITYKILLIT